MKKFFCIILAGLFFSLTACGENTEPVDIEGLQDKMESTGTALETETESETGTESETPEEHQVLYYMIENPSWEYYLTDSIPSEDDTCLKLEQLTEEANEIIDTEKWFAENGLEQPLWNSIEDELYRYEITGDSYPGYLIDMYKKDTGEYLQCLDFSEYRYAEDFKEEDRDYIEQGIWWVQSVDDVLYVAIGHNTYAESSPHTGYLTAVNLNDMSVIWKSEPCTTNARTFEIVDNTIICGYGFTSEPDYLILVNRLDGTQIEKIPIKTQAEYIICKDDVLFVRTYNTNYTFRMYMRWDS